MNEPKCLSMILNGCREKEKLGLTSSIGKERKAYTSISIPFQATHIGKLGVRLEAYKV